MNKLINVAFGAWALVSLLLAYGSIRNMRSIPDWAAETSASAFVLAGVVLMALFLWNKGTADKGR